MKRLITAIAVTLAIASTVPTAWATGTNGDSQTTHFVDSAAYPNNARIPYAIHEFELHVAGRAISQLSIRIPEGIDITNGIEVTDNLGSKVQATVSVNDRKATIDFAQSVPRDTLLLIQMKGVTSSGLQARSWFYNVSAKMVGLTAEIPLGSAQIRTYD